MPEPIKVFAANLWVVFNFDDFDDPYERYQRFLHQGRAALKQFIDFIVLHDAIVIPTQDFMSLASLINIFGEQTILDLLDADCLRFLRLKGSLGYFATNWGKGCGLSGYEIYDDNNAGQPVAFCAPTDLALASALNSLPKALQEREKIASNVLQVTQEVSIEAIQQQIRHETYMDILNSPRLQERFALRSTHMSRLSGVAPDALRIYVGPYHNPVDEIDTVLLLAATNLVEMILC